MGVVSIAAPYDDRWFFAEVLRGAREHIEAAGHTVIVHVIPPSPTATVAAVSAIAEDFAAADSIGAIAVGFRSGPDQASRVLAWERPLVLIGGSALGFPTVMIDDIGASRAATQHLLDLGHRRITHFAGDLHDQMDFSVHSRRARGYRQAMEQTGLEPVVIEVAFDRDAARAVALEVLADPDRPTAVFAVSDEVALGVLDAARELGLEVGRDFSVVGFDDEPRAEAADLTTVRQRPDDLGAAAADLLLSGIGHGPDPEQSRLMPTGLVQRGSTGPLVRSSGPGRAR
ncbi:LacI family DNA-binding transcriptional regulator [uncultured Amnibacterium sp.]|uniref:LacI family DNA-binding transcriptional regulator n=1 Tax=uncultured Amnibacterium sp. TaxID=1631851 RepID=UPI0035CC8630